MREELGGHGTGEMPEMNMNRRRGEGGRVGKAKQAAPPGNVRVRVRVNKGRMGAFLLRTDDGSTRHVMT